MMRSSKLFVGVARVVYVAAPGADGNPEVNPEP